MLDQTTVPSSIDDINEMAYEGASIHEVIDELKVYPEEEQPVLIIIGGRSGCGKSTTSLRLANDMGAINLSADARRKALFGCDVHEKLDAQYYIMPPKDEQGHAMEGSPDYVQEHRENFHDEIEQVLYAGKSVVVDMPSTNYLSRKEFEDIAERCGAKFSGVFLDVPRDVAESRIIERAEAGPDASDMTAQVFNKIEDRNDRILIDRNKEAIERGRELKDDLIHPSTDEASWTMIDGTMRPQDVYGQVVAKIEIQLERELVPTPEMDELERA